MLLERAVSRFEGKILEANNFSFSLIMLKMGQYQIGKPINPIQRKLLIVVLRKRKVFMAGADPSSVVVVRSNQNKHCPSNQASTMSENLSTTYLCLDYKNCGGKGCCKLQVMVFTKSSLTVELYSYDHGSHPHTLQ